jgi:hypothetical protein
MPGLSNGASQNRWNNALCLLRVAVDLRYLAALWLSADVAELADALDSKFENWAFLDISRRFFRIEKRLVFIGQIRLFSTISALSLRVRF